MPIVYIRLYRSQLYIDVFTENPCQDSRVAHFVISIVYLYITDLLKKIMQDFCKFIYSIL